MLPIPQVPVPQRMETEVVLVPLPIVMALALVVPMFSPAAPPVSMDRLLAPPEEIDKAPPAVRTVLVPSETVPEPACKVRLPAPVLQTAAAAEVRVKAPELVVRELAALPARLTAPPEVVIPALPVMRLEKVLAPARVWPEVLIRPMSVALADCRYRELPTMVAPLALGPWVSTVPIELTPVPVAARRHKLAPES